MDQVREALKAVMEEKGPDFIYSPYPGAGCFNVPIGLIPEAHKTYDDIDPNDQRLTTGCLVGETMARLGVPSLALAGWENAATDIATLANDLRKRGIIELDVVQLAYLSKAQRRQDDGHSWGDAVDAAEAYLTETETDLHL